MTIQLPAQSAQENGGRGRLTEEDIHAILSNERRRLVLELLRSNGEEMSLRELSERIAEAETGENPPPRNKRQSAYVSLHQTHLPKLEDYDIVSYNETGKNIQLQEQASEVNVYLETVPKYGISWSEFYIGLGIIGILVMTGAIVGVPFLTSISAVTWAYLALFAIVLSSIYQMIDQSNSLLHRLKE